EDHLTGADAPRLAVAGRDLHAGVQVDDVLAPGRGMPVEVVVGRDLTEDDAAGRQARGHPPGSRLFLELDLEVLPVRLALFVRIEPVDFHRGLPPLAADGNRPRIPRRASPERSDHGPSGGLARTAQSEELTALMRRVTGPRSTPRKARSYRRGMAR